MSMRGWGLGMQVHINCHSVTVRHHYNMFPPDSTETFMVAQTQQAVSDYCKHFECTPLGCGPWPPEDLGKCSAFR